MNDKGHLLAVAIAFAPAALIAWMSGARGVFAAGVIGATIGLVLTPSVTVEFGPGATERDFILSTLLFDAPWTCGGAIVGSYIGVFVRDGEGQRRARARAERARPNASGSAPR